MDKIPPVVFRGYDIRGEVGSQLTDHSYQVLGYSYAEFLKRRGVFDTVVARDVRESSGGFARAFLDSLISFGVNVYDIGIVPTQMAYFAQYLFLTKAAAIITASHLPLKYNGLKLASGFSETFVSQEMAEIKAISENFEMVGQTPIKGDVKGALVDKDVFAEYKNDLLKRVKKPQRRLKVVIDSGGGTTGAYLPSIIADYGCEVISQFTDFDPKLSLGTPDPTEEVMLKRLSDRVLSEKADIGLAFDCDGDRLGVVDQNGRIIWNDTLVSLFATGVLQRMPGAPIVYNALCSRSVEETVIKHKGEPVMWITGHSFIKQKVKELRSPFGGELSGHFFFMDNFFGHDDGAMSSLRLLEILSSSTFSFSEIVDQLPSYITSPEIKLGYPDDIKNNFVSKEAKLFLEKLFPNSKYYDLDGFRAENEHSMAIIRPSQNGPYITIKFEAKQKDEYERIKENIKNFLHSDSNVIWSEGVNIASLN